MLIKIGLNVLAWFISISIGALLSFPLGIFFISIARVLKHKIFDRVSSLLLGVSTGTLTVMVANYFLKLFNLSLSWWLTIFLVLGFIYNQGRRVLGSLHNKDLFYHELIDGIGIIIALIVASFYFI